VNAALGASFDEAEQVLLARFGEVTLAMLASDVGKRMKAHKHHKGPKKAHGEHA
jgi:hypothetical protein